MGSEFQSWIVVEGMVVHGQIKASGYVQAAALARVFFPDLNFRLILWRQAMRQQQEAASKCRVLTVDVALHRGLIDKPVAEWAADLQTKFARAGGGR